MQTGANDMQAVKNGVIVLLLSLFNIVLALVFSCLLLLLLLHLYSKYFIFISEQLTHLLHNFYV